MKNVIDILNDKGTEIVSAHPEETVYEALEKMADNNIGALLVLENGKIEGIFSERDYARKVALKGQSSKELKVKDIMSPRVYYVRPEQNINECMALMLEQKIRHLPVIDDNGLRGLISIGDVVREVISEQNMMIDELTRYITGR